MASTRTSGIRSALAIAVTLCGAPTAFAIPVTWTFSGNIKYSSDAAFGLNDPVNGAVTIDTGTPGVFYNGGLSAQYSNAVTALSLSIPTDGITYSLSSGAGHFQVQDYAFGDYEAIIYGNNWTGAYFSNSGTPENVTGIEIFLRSLANFLASSGTTIPSSPYDLSLIPYTWDQNGLGATFEFYPNGGYVRGQITNLTLQSVVAVPEPSTLAIFGAGLLGLASRRMFSPVRVHDLLRQLLRLVSG